MQSADFGHVSKGSQMIIQGAPPISCLSILNHTYENLNRENIGNWHKLLFINGGSRVGMGHWVRSSFHPLGWVSGFWIFPWVKEFWLHVHFGSKFFFKSYIFELNKRFSTSKKSGQAKIAIEAGHLL